MFAALGYRICRWRCHVLALAGVLVAAATLWGPGVFGVLVDGGFDDPASESMRADDQIAARIAGTRPDVVAIYRSADATVDEPAFRAAVEGVLARLPATDVVSTTTYWQSQVPAMVAFDRHATYVLVELVGADTGERADTFRRIRDDLAAPGLDVALSGMTAVFDEINATVRKDVARAEAISAPIVLALLLIMFGSVVAASLPLAIGAIAVLGAFSLLRLISSVTDISVFSVNIVTMLGLGLAVDYALLMLSRFREELPRHDSVEAALARTMATAGRTVAFSGVTVAVSLAGLLLFPTMFLRSMGFGGIVAVVVAMVGALTVLPALLSVLGRRVDALRVGLPLPPGLHAILRRRATNGPGGWYRLANLVMRRPLAAVLATGVILVLFGAPFLGARWGGVDTRMLPESAPSRVATEQLARDFEPNVTTPIEIVLTGGRPDSVTRYLDLVRSTPGVSSTRIGGQADGTTLINVGFGAAWDSAEAQRLVADLRQLPGPAEATRLVGGVTAMLTDRVDGIARTLPWAALLAVGATLVLLFLAFGSVVLPVKAVIMNTLSIVASFGLVVWIFQDGHLSGLLDFTATGSLAPGNLVLMLAVVFGLSMDYEVFLLSRIREQWDTSPDNTTAVATGLQRSSPIITSAALLLVVVIGAFSTSNVSMIKMIGVGLAVAILLDATVIRAMLVPATMCLLGRANWWAPRPLAAFWRRYGVREAPEPVAPEAAEALLA